jgi:hypothetical protein
MQIYNADVISFIILCSLFALMVVYLIGHIHREFNRMILVLFVSGIAICTTEYFMLVKPAVSLLSALDNLLWTVFLAVMVHCCLLFSGKEHQVLRTWKTRIKFYGPLVFFSALYFILPPLIKDSNIPYWFQSLRIEFWLFFLAKIAYTTIGIGFLFYPLLNNHETPRRHQAEFLIIMVMATFLYRVFSEVTALAYSAPMLPLTPMLVFVAAMLLYAMRKYKLMIE